MSDFVIGWLFGHLLIGSLVWMLWGGTAYTGFVISFYCQQHGRLPPRGYVAFAILVMILFWPKVAVAKFKAKRGLV